MEIVEVASNVITNLGFPIAMCGAMFWKMNEQDKAHKEEVGKLTTALEHNTVVMEEIKVVLEDFRK